MTNSIGMSLAKLPAGHFHMGSDETEAIELGNGPRHTVEITRPFWIGKYEVTQEQYQRIMNQDPSRFCAAGDEAEAVAGLDTSRFPVDHVTWEEAIEFCRRLTALAEEKEAGRSYRLPTDAEWEYACRAGDDETSAASGRLNSATANISGPADGDSQPLGRTAAVGSYAANAWGLHDMHGNVWEWCLDGRREYSSNAVDDPRGPDMLEAVLRGGAWDFPADYTRSDCRQRALKGYVYFGFRVVCEQTD